MKNREEILDILRSELPELRKRFGIERIAVYGSAAKGDQTEKSDIDILVELTQPLGLEFVHLAYRLEEILGAEVDLATFNDLRVSMHSARYQHIAANIQRTLTYV